MNQLINLLKGKFAQVSCKHDASRVVQAALQYANESQRNLIIQELCAPALVDPQKQQTSSKNSGISYLVQLASSQYAHFIVLKMIKICNQDPDNIETIVQV